MLVATTNIVNQWPMGLENYRVWIPRALPKHPSHFPRFFYWLFWIASTSVVVKLKGLKFTKRAMNGAAAAGNLEMVRYLHGKQVECSTDAMDRAAQEGHLEVVQVRTGLLYSSAVVVVL